MRSFLFRSTARHLECLKFGTTSYLWFLEAYIGDMNVFLDMKDVDSSGSRDLEEEEGDSEEVLSLKSDNSASESVGCPPQKILLKKNRSK